jgi:hypothetical protein
MMQYVRAQDKFKCGNDIKIWSEQLSHITNTALRDEFVRIQVQLATIINRCVYKEAGMFNDGYKSVEEVKERLSKQGDHREFNMLGGMHNFMT